jgi:hypothetical protein
MLGDGIDGQQTQHAFRSLLPFGGSLFAGRTRAGFGGIFCVCGMKRAGKDDCQREAVEEGKGHWRTQLL